MIKKGLLFIILLTVCAIVKAQSTTTVYDGTELKKGDVLTVGYHYVTASHYGTIKEKIINDYGKEEYRNVKDDILYNKLTVVDFIESGKAKMFYNNNQVVIAKTDAGKEYYIEIDNSIEKGEIVSSPAQTLYEDAVFLSDALLMACVIRVNKIEVTDNVFLSFLGTQDKELQRKSYSDEFELNKAKQQYMPVLQKMMDEFDFTKTYYIKNQMEIGKYDFDVKGYPITIFAKQETFLPYGNHYNFVIEKGREKFKMLPVTMEDGERINKRRKGIGKFGYISPLVYGKFYFRLLDKRVELPKNNIVNMENLYRHTVVGAELLGLEVYDFEHCEYNLIGTIRQ